MRLRVAVCDSQPDTLSRMERFLVDTKLVSCVTCYNNVRELRDELNEGKEIDLLILDIDHAFDKTVAEDEGKNGIDFACELGQKYPFLQIIYMAEQDVEYAQTIFLRPVQPAGFLIKPVKMDYVYQLLLLAIERQKNDSQERLVVQSKTRQVFYSWEIRYLESEGHVTKIHMANGKIYECKDKISELEQKAGKEFVRCHQSFLVNLRYVACLGKENSSDKKKEKGKKTKQEVPKETSNDASKEDGTKTQRDVLVLENGEMIGISKRWCGETKRRFEEYLGIAEDKEEIVENEGPFLDKKRRQL